MSDAQFLPESFEGGGRGTDEGAAERPVVTLLSDFGAEEHYVGVMKGVILAIAREAQVVDITHAVPPYDVEAGALILSGACHYFPKGTIHVAVVDPGVGSDRRAILAATENYYFVGPDNGLLTDIFDDPLYLWTRKLVTVEYFLEKVSSTFHGRDIFAPVAGHLARGEDPADFGPLIDDPVRLERPRPQVGPEGDITGEVVHVDHYGNLVTNIDTSAFWLGESRAGDDDEEFIPLVEVAGRTIRGMSEYYQSAPRGRMCVHLNSWSRLEVFLPEGNAARELGAGRGAAVRVRFERRT